MKIWLVEDDGFKREKLKAALLELLPAAEIQEAKSAKTAFNLLSAGMPKLIVLDMSLPTFDIGPFEAGGRPQGFGGVEVLREMERREIVAPVVVVTQYEVFGEERLGIGELAKRLEKEHPETFTSLVYYDSGSEQWKKDFAIAVNKALSGGGV
jgi:CheY-like chemotaxis protein